MERYDENEDGYLSEEEFETFYDEVMEMASGGEHEDEHEGHNHKRVCFDLFYYYYYYYYYFLC